MDLIPWLAIAGLVFIYLIYKILDLKRELREKPVIFADTTGIFKNPPNYIELKQNKTINFIVDKYTISICELPAIMCLRYIEKFALMFNALKILARYKPVSKLDEIRHIAQHWNAYNNVIKIIYILSFQFVNKKRGYRKALFDKAKEDVIWLYNLCEEVLDYWAYIKKKLDLLAMGKTLRQMHGDQFSWNSLKMDTHGKILITPRFGKSLNVSKSLTKEHLNN